MTAKDYVYLGLIVAAAVVFYLHGFNAGAEETRKRLTRFFHRHQESLEPPQAVETDPAVLLRWEERSVGPEVDWRRSIPISGDFSNN